MPAERCFAPIAAPNYMYISCLWVSGKYKGQGYANQLLEECIKDAKAKGKSGLVALGSKKKMHFLTDPKFLKYKGFEICDRVNPSFELLYLPFEEDITLPRFNDCIKSGSSDENGVVIYYSNGCPHTDKYIPIEENLLKQRKIPYHIRKIETLEEAKNAPTPCTNYSLFINGNFITSEVLTEKRLNKYLDEWINEVKE